MVEMLFNSELNDYTFKKEIKKIKSIRKVPLKFKLEDSTAKYRIEILRKEILN